MPFTLEEVDIATDFAELIACEWVSYENPLQTFFRLFCPIHGSGPDAHTESLKEATARQLEWHRADPTSYWQKVTNSTTGKIVAGALWKICKTDPYEKPDEHTEAYWFPKGGARDFVNQALEQFEAPRARMARRPQVCMYPVSPSSSYTIYTYLFLVYSRTTANPPSVLNIIFTHPSSRRQGAADLILNWGIQKAAELGVEMWLDATVYGVPLYKKHGFIVVNENVIRPHTANPDEEWKRVEAELMPITMWQMWRPVGGKYEEGKTVRPWEVEGEEERVLQA